jgi:transposase
MTQRLFSLSISTAMWSKVAMQKRYVVNLTDQERAGLEGVVRGRGAIGKRQRAQILLKADEGLTDSEIAEELAVDQRTVERVRERCCTTGLQAAVEARKPARPPRNPLLDGKAEARLVEIACTEPPDGRAKWTLSLLANRMVELRVVDSVSKSTICRGLKKTL